MRRLILAAIAVATVAAVPASVSAQEVREQRRVELQQRAEQRRAELRQRAEQRRVLIEQRRPQIAQRLQERRLQGRTVQVRPLVRKQLIERRLRSNTPDAFERLDLNKDGVLSRDEFLQSTRRRIGRT